ncbi:MAG: apolipoprotein N-acyltransferase [Clostridia bacterium]|nr:apolipoprotein N-acyltransferase [Clostridia bacterium]
MTYFLSVALGALTALPMVFDRLFFLPWLTLPVWLILILKSKAPYRHGLIWSLGYYFVVFSWLIELYPMDFAGFSNGMSVLIIFLGITVLTLSQSFLSAFMPLIYKKSAKYLPPAVTAILAGALWCLIEWIQTLPWFMVPWGKLALTQTFLLPEIQSASLLGSYFTGFLMMSFAGFIAAFFCEAISPGRPLRIEKSELRPVYGVIALIIFVSNTAFGVIKLSLPEKSGTKVTAAAIQGNISSVDKWADGSVSRSLDIYSDLTKKAAGKGARLIVWPESVITESLNRNNPVSSKIAALAAETGCDIAVGAFYTEGTGDNVTDFNAVYYYHPDGSVSENVYRKRHLVPFGEYVPMRPLIMKLFPFLGDINMFSADVGRGTGTELFTDERGTAGALVCFDSIYPDLARQSAAEGADIILLSTNDSWYKDSTAVYQHNRHAALRAVETGRFIVRAANTGVSSVIDKNGRIKDTLPPLTDGFITGDVYYENTRTPYTLLGDVIVWFSAAFTAVCSIAAIIGAKKTKERKNIQLNSQKEEINER